MRGFYDKINLRNFPCIDDSNYSKKLLDSCISESKIALRKMEPICLCSSIYLKMVLYFLY